MEGTLSQPYLFAAAMYVGILGAAIYFLLSWLGKILQKRAWQIVLDILYSLLVLAAMAGMLYLVADLKVRGFYFIGAGLGFAIYCLGIKPALGCICKLLRPRGKSKSK
jgi:hypothetical protein